MLQDMVNYEVFQTGLWFHESAVLGASPDLISEGGCFLLLQT